MAKKKIDIENLDEVIAYSEEVSPDRGEHEDKDQLVLSKFKDEFTDMKSWRTEYETEWDICDWQMEANTFYDEQWVLQVNPPMEQALVELAIGRKAWQINYNLESIGKKPNVQDLQVSKFSLAHYMRTEQFHNKVKDFRYDCAVYGTGIFFTGVIINREKCYKHAEWIASDKAYWNTEYDEYYETTYQFTWRNVPLRDFWISKDWLTSRGMTASKAVMKETMCLEEFHIKFGDETIFRNVKNVTTGQSDTSPSYGETKNLSTEEVIVYYYYDKIDKDYRIIANEDYVIFTGKMTNKNKRLPFRSKQHYTNYKCFYGIGIPRKVRYLKAYKAELLQDLLAQSKLWGPNIIAWNQNTLNDEMLNNPWEVNVWKFSGDISNIRTFQYQPDISKYVTMLQVIDDLVIQDTGENLRGTYEALAPQLWTVEIIENARQTRLASPDENDDTFLCEVLTDALDNITQYAYKLQTKTTMNEDWDIEEVEYPIIQVKDMRIEYEDDGSMVFVEDLGEEWFFEFREEMITWRYFVKVVTNSNVQTQKTLEKNSITQHVNNIATIAQFAPQIVQEEDIRGLFDYMKTLNNLDEKYDVDTKRDKLKKEAEEMMQNIYQSLGVLPQQDQNAMTQDMAPQGIPTQGWAGGWANQLLQGQLWASPRAGEMQKATSPNLIGA